MRLMTYPVAFVAIPTMLVGWHWLETHQEGETPSPHWSITKDMLSPLCS